MCFLFHWEPEALETGCSTLTVAGDAAEGKRSFNKIRSRIPGSPTREMKFTKGGA